MALASIVSGVSTTLLARHVLGAQSSILSGAASSSAISPLFNYRAAFASVFVTVLLWLALWGLGALGAGPAGRAAEVYGAAFLPTLIWAVVLLPVALFFAPQVAVAAPNLSGLSGAALQKAVQTYILQVQAASSGNPVNTVTTWLGYAVYLWQFALAFVGFRVLTGQPGKAWRGVPPVPTRACCWCWRRRPGWPRNRSGVCSAATAARSCGGVRATGHPRRLGEPEQGLHSGPIGERVGHGAEADGAAQQPADAQHRDLDAGPDRPQRPAGAGGEPGHRPSARSGAQRAPM